jgi:hypothetical protein
MPHAWARRRPLPAAHHQQPPRASAPARQHETQRLTARKRGVPPPPGCFGTNGWNGGRIPGRCPTKSSGRALLLLLLTHKGRVTTVRVGRGVRRRGRADRAGRAAAAGASESACVTRAFCRGAPFQRACAAERRWVGRGRRGAQAPRKLWPAAVKCPPRMRGAGGRRPRGGCASACRWEAARHFVGVCLGERGGASPWEPAAAPRRCRSSAQRKS